MYKHSTKKPSTNKYLGKKKEIYLVDFNNGTISSIDADSSEGKHLLEICRRQGDGQPMQMISLEDNKLATVGMPLAEVTEAVLAASKAN